MCDVDSRDLRVQSAVRQIVQLMGMVQSGDQLQLHFFIPCLVVRSPRPVPLLSLARFFLVTNTYLRPV